MYSPDRAGSTRRRRAPHRLTFAIALSIAAFAACAACGTAYAGKAAAKAADVDTEHLFGFTEGSDIGEAGERELESDTTLRSGKTTGAFNDTASELEFKYTAFESFRISAAATLAYYDIGGVTGMDDRRQGSLQSLSFDARYRLLDRDRAPFGMTVSVEPHWGFVDETSGTVIRHFGWEGDLLFDRALVPDRLFGALNLHYDTDRSETAAGGGSDQQPTLGVFLALAGQAMPGVWIGGEARYFRAYQGADRNLLRRCALSRPDALHEARREDLALRRLRRAGAGPQRHGPRRARSRGFRALPGQFSAGLRVLTAVRRRGRSHTSSRTRPSSTSLWASVISSWTRCMHAAAASPVPSWVTV